MLDVHAGKTKVKDQLRMPLSLMSDLRPALPVSLPEWIHPAAHRRSLWQRERGDAPSEPRGSGGLHSEGRTRERRSAFAQTLSFDQGSVSLPASSASGSVWSHCPTSTRCRCVSQVRASVRAL